MFILGECDHYIELKWAHPDLYKSHGPEWSLKEYGCLFAYDQMVSRGVRDMLEFGPGFSLFFSEQAHARNIGYTSIDRSNNELGIGEQADRFQARVATRQARGQTHVTGLLGPDSAGLDDESFDLITSVSVIEHIDDTHMQRVANEAARLLRPGGVLVNSIDIYRQSRKHLVWHGACTLAGLTVPPPHRCHDWHFAGNHTTFLEDQRIRYVVYNSLTSADPRRDGLRYSSHFATALHVAHKPA